MNWKLIVAAGALAGAAALAARRRSQKWAVDGDLWSSATDPVEPSGS